MCLSRTPSKGPSHQVTLPAFDNIRPQHRWRRLTEPVSGGLGGPLMDDRVYCLSVTTKKYPAVLGSVYGGCPMALRQKLGDYSRMMAGWKRKKREVCSIPNRAVKRWKHLAASTWWNTFYLEGKTQSLSKQAQLPAEVLWSPSGLVIMVFIRCDKVSLKI